MAINDTVFQKLLEKEGCQWIGDQDPRTQTVKYCGCKVIPGKSYCEEHYVRVYMGGLPNKRRSAKVVAKKQHTWAPGELEDLLQEVYDELVAEGEIEA